VHKRDVLVAELKRQATAMKRDKQESPITSSVDVG